DDNALFRQPTMAAIRHDNETNFDAPTETSRELEAQRFNINYVMLPGTIGVVSNGAGLALATNDAIVDAGGAPANFMDIRTTATSIDIADGLGLLLDDPRLKAILVNVHGGGMQRCDTVAEAIGMAIRKKDLKVPLVVRLAGNNAEFAKTVLKNNGVPYIGAETMEQATQHAVAAAAGQTIH
ncbi:MAG: succinyl-CoA synthetase subunit beta, partial [Pseudomonadota bacterium]